MLTLLIVEVSLIGDLRRRLRFNWLVASPVFFSYPDLFYPRVQSFKKIERLILIPSSRTPRKQQRGCPSFYHHLMLTSAIASSNR
jgi:hypothetical protein